MRANQRFIEAIEQDLRHQGIKKLSANALPVPRRINPQVGNVIALRDPRAPARQSSSPSGNQNTVRILLKIVQEFGFKGVLSISGQFSIARSYPPSADC